jgi:beta-RFAP synthase
MMRVRTASRLHFGLLSLPVNESSQAAWPNVEGQRVVPTRAFGSVGLMIERPGLVVWAESSSAWSTEGALPDRTSAYANQAASALHWSGALHFRVEGSPRQHIGLGVGTQLALAVARLVAQATGCPELTSTGLAVLVGRGQRSALGVHGFAHGGFLVEGGKPSAQTLAPLVARVPFPSEWRVLLVIPRNLHGAHGPRETEAFQALSRRAPDLSRTEVLCRLVLLGMLPALAERNLIAFGEALYDFNRRVGEMFRPWQGDVYSHPRTAELVNVLRSRYGVRGSGQSSWGPTVFAVTTAEHADGIASDLVRHHGCHADEVIVTAAANTGATIDG